VILWNKDTKSTKTKMAGKGKKEEEIKLSKKDQKKVDKLTA
jgi:hypothetical protein